jgi:hypothetical protein
MDNRPAALSASSGPTILHLVILFFLLGNGLNSRVRYAGWRKIKKMQ